MTGRQAKAAEILRLIAADQLAGPGFPPDPGQGGGFVLESLTLEHRLVEREPIGARHAVVYGPGELCLTLEFVSRGAPAVPDLQRLPGAVLILGPTEGKILYNV